MNRFRRSLVGLVLVVAVLVVGTLSPSLASSAAPAATGDPIGELSSCVRSTGVLEALFLFDTSASLQKTDPGNRRIVAANAALTALADLASSGKESPTTVDVRFAQFSVDYVPAADWQSLDRESLSAVRDSAAAIAARNDGIDTDFTTALSGARTDLADRTAKVRGNDGQPPCQALFVFTDGKFDVEPRVGRLSNAPGTPKVYAPDTPANNRENADQIIAAGKEALCRVGGIADSVRIDDVTVIAIALSGSISDDDQQFLASVATGRSGETSCGDPAKARGAYFAADDLGTLISAFNRAASSIAGGTLVPGTETVAVCAGQPCAEGGRTFTSSAAMSRVTALVDNGRSGGSVVLRAPDGTSASLTPASPDARLSGAVITSRWFDDAVASVNIELTDHVTSVGEWTVTLVAPKSGLMGRIQLFAYTDLSAQLTSDPDLRIGQKSEFKLQIGGADPASRLVGSRSVVSISASDPSTGQPVTIPLTASNSGTWSGSWSVPEEWTASETVLATRLELVTSTGLALEPVVTRTAVKVQKPASYPQISPASLRLATVDGKGRAKGSITVTGGTQAGCVAFGDVTYSAIPSPTQPPAFESPLKSGDCLAVEPGTTKVIPISFKLSKSSDGPVRAVLPVVVSSEADPTRRLTTDIPVAFETRLAVDPGIQLLILILLVLGGLGIPFLLLYLVNWKSALYADLDVMRGVRLRMLVHPDGSLEGVDEDGNGTGTTPMASVDSWSNLGDAGRRKSFQWNGVSFETSLPRFPIGEPYGVARAGGSSIGDFPPGQKERNAKIGLGLLTSWVLVLHGESPSDRQAGETGSPPVDAVDVTLILFAHAGTETQHVESFLARSSVTIEHAARRLAKDARSTRPQIPETETAGTADLDDLFWEDEVSAGAPRRTPGGSPHSPPVTSNPQAFDDEFWDD